MISDKPHIWRPYILDNEPTQYEVSNYGEIRNVKTGHQLIAVPLQKSGYLRVLIYRNGTRVDKKVHRIVWEAFKGPIPKGMTIDHIDEDKTNNSIYNLRLMTPSENVKQFLKNHPDHGYQKSIDDKFIRKYFELLKNGVYYKRAWSQAVPIKGHSGYAKYLLYGMRRPSLWEEYQPFPFSAYYDIEISEKDQELIQACIISRMDTEKILRLIGKEYFPFLIDVVYFFRSQCDENHLSGNYYNPIIIKDMDALLSLGLKDSRLISILHLPDNGKVRCLINKRKDLLEITRNHFNHISDELAARIKVLVEEGRTNEEIFSILKIARSKDVASFMTSYRSHYKHKMNSEKTSSTIESITSQDVKK